MKFLLAIQLVASCQAFSIESLIEKEAFNFAIHEAVDELERSAVSELKNALLGEGRGISDSDVEKLHTFASVLGEASRDEMYKVLTYITNAADMKIAISYASLEKLSLIDIFGKINDTLRRIIANLHGKFHDLHNFLQSFIKDNIQQLRHHVDNIKILTKDTVSAKVGMFQAVTHRVGRYLEDTG